MPVLISDGERTVLIDRSTNGLLVASHGEIAVHYGNTYRVAASLPALADGDTVSIEILTPDSKTEIHWSADVVTTNAATVEGFENVSVTSNGTTLTALNDNRNFPDASAMQIILKDSTVDTSGATQIGKKYIGDNGNRGKGVMSGTAGTVSEWILKANTWYHFKITNTCGASQAVTLGFNWHEHTPETNG